MAAYSVADRIQSGTLWELNLRHQTFFFSKIFAVF